MFEFSVDDQCSSLACWLCTTIGVFNEFLVLAGFITVTGDEMSVKHQNSKMFVFKLNKCE